MGGDRVKHMEDIHVFSKVSSGAQAQEKKKSQYETRLGTRDDHYSKNRNFKIINPGSTKKEETSQLNQFHTRRLPSKKIGLVLKGGRL